MTAAPPKRPGALSGAVLLFTAAYGAILVWAMANVTYDVWGGLLFFPILLVVGIALVTRTSRRDGEVWTTRLLVTALCLKMGGTLLRYAVAFEVYGGAADATGYHGWGAFIANHWRRGDFIIEYEQKKGEGTVALRFITAVIYMLVGPSKLGGFLAFSLLGFFGLFLFYRAFRIAVPHGNHRRYAVLLFFLPSLLYWPSSIGKDSWMLFTLGVATYGAARFMVRMPRGLPILVLGVWGTALVRPHVTLIFLVSLGVGFLLRRSRPDRPLAPVAKLLGGVVLAVCGLVLVSRTESFLRVDELDFSSVDQVFSNVQDRTSGGGSRFEPPGVDSPLALPEALITVAFRPFPTEAHNAQAVVASVESTLLLGLTCLSLSRLLGVPRQLRNAPYVAVAVAFTLLFAFAFANVGNFGILTRERVQFLPFFLVLLAVPPRHSPGGAKHSPARRPTMTLTSARAERPPAATTSA